MEKGLPQHLFELLRIDHLQRHGASKKAITRAFDDDVEFRSAWQNTSGTWLKPLLTIRLILIQRYKTDEYSTRNAGWKLAERVGMDSVDRQELITTLRQTAFKGDASDAQFIALLIVANQYGLNPWTKEIYAFPDKQNGIVPVVASMAGPVSSMKTSSLMAWTLSRTMNPAHAGFTARTVIIRSALPSGWMNAAANHSKPAKAEKSRGRGSRIPNGCYVIKP